MSSGHKTDRGKLSGKAKKWIWVSVFLVVVGLYLQFGSVVFHNWQEHELLNEKLLGRIQIIRIPARYLNYTDKLFIYTPPDYNKTQKRYPVIYMFHGMPGAGRDWFVKGRVHTTAESLIMSGKIQQVIIVGFDTFGRLSEHSRTEYLDSDTGGIQVESHITREIIPYIDSHYRTIKDNRARAIIGLSSGGYGALNIGLKHQNMFLTVASHSGFFNPIYENKYVTGILGQYGPAWDANNPHMLLSRTTLNPRFRVYMDIGRDDDLLNDNRLFAAELKKFHILGEFHIVPGEHKWSLWRNRIYYSLIFTSNRFKTLLGEPLPSVSAFGADKNSTVHDRNLPK